MTDHEHEHDEDSEYVSNETPIQAIGFSISNTEDLTEPEVHELGPFPFVLMIPVLLEDGKFAVTFRAHGFDSALQAAKMAHTMIDAVGVTATNQAIEEKARIEAENEGVNPLDVQALRAKFDQLVEGFNTVLTDDIVCRCTDVLTKMEYNGQRDDFTCPVCSVSIAAEYLNDHPDEFR